MPRSTRLFLNSAVAAAALAATALAAGCSTESSSSDPSAGSPAPLDDENANPGNPKAGSEDAAAVKMTAYRGNPLCHVVAPTDCMPDDDGSRLTTGTSECAQPAPDAGDAGAADFQSGGCRIARVDGDIVSHCFSTAAANGRDGASCENGSECAPGFDCIAGEKGGKTCRRYCCLGTCKGQLSQNGGATFCDIQSLVDVNQKAPVCMPLKRCKLLGSGECTTNETCAVVTESGDTGCVALGEQQVGASCDDQHCAATLTCLGQPGSRKCYKLCKVGASECGSSQVCRTSTVFKDPAFGTCQKP